MTKPARLYTAMITKSDETFFHQVDIFNLPYNEFDEQCPLVISDDVDMGKSKKRDWPDLSNVIMFGTFDCSNFAITPETPMPRKFKRLICRFSIKDLGDLIGLLPAGVKSVVVRSALMNNIKKNKDNALATARQFVTMYPNVNVTDEKQTLADILHGIDHISEPVAGQATCQKINPGEKYAIKSDPWLDTTELAVRCAALSDKIASLTEESRRRYVRMARSSKVGLNLKTAYLRRPTDGEIVRCTHQDSAPTCVDYILGCLFEQEQDIGLLKSVQKHDNNEVTTKQQTQTTLPTSTEQKMFFGADEVRPIVIKKYISKSAWTQIRAKCACSTSELLRLLNDIECINVDPASTKGASVVYVQNGLVHKSRTVKFKSVHCLCQGFGSKDNRSRLVWGMSGNIFVCQKFFADHSTNYDYQRYIRDLDVDMSALDLSEFFYVPDLINDLSGGREDTSDKDVSCDKAEASSVSDSVDETIKTSEYVPETKKVTNPVRDKEEVKNDTLAHSRIKSQHICRSASSPVVSANMPSKAFVETKKTPTDWVDLYSLNYSIVQQYECLQKRQSGILEQMLSEPDTEKMMRMNCELQQVLQSKHDCEKSLQKLKAINQSLLDLQHEFEKKHLK